MLDLTSSVEVGYGFHAIRSKLLIANDMYGSIVNPSICLIVCLYECDYMIVIK